MCECVFSLKCSIYLWPMNKWTIFICIFATYYCLFADTQTFLFPVKHPWNIYSTWAFQPCVTTQYYVYGILNISYKPTNQPNDRPNDQQINQASDLRNYLKLSLKNYYTHFVIIPIRGLFDSIAVTHTYRKIFDNF